MRISKGLWFSRNQIAKPLSHKMASKNLEKNTDPRWKIFTALRDKTENQSHIPSYEEFLAKKNDSHDVADITGGTRPTSEFKNGEDKTFNLIDPKYKYEGNDQLNSSDDEWTEVESDGDDVGMSELEGKTKQNHKNTCRKDWSESSSDPEKDQALDDFIKKLSSELGQSEACHDENQHYTSLTDYMSHEDRKEENFRSRKPTVISNDEDYMLPNDLDLSLEQKLPLMQVLDTIGDINKVLKAGKLTPRMERIMEYKQDHPFRDGYQEEELGCCPWLVYKLERLSKRFFASQWPNVGRFE